MQREHPADRLARRLRTPFILSIYAGGPIALMSYAAMVHWLVTTAPWWISIPSITSHLAVSLGVSSLIDRTEEQRQRSADEQ